MPKGQLYILFIRESLSVPNNSLTINFLEKPVDTQQFFDHPFFGETRRYPTILGPSVFWRNPSIPNNSLTIRFWEKPVDTQQFFDHPFFGETRRYPTIL